jgi:hypothetical protein
MIKNTCGPLIDDVDISSLTVDGLITNDRTIICNDLDKKIIFTPPTSATSPELQSSGLEDRNLPHFVLVPVEEFEIYKIVCELPTKKSFGWDGMSAKILKRISLFIL